MLRGEEAAAVSSTEIPAVVERKASAGSRPTAAELSLCSSGRR
jgi:hypothetical protein